MLWPSPAWSYKAIRTGHEVEAGQLATALETELAPSLVSREACGWRGRLYESTYLLMPTFPQAAHHFQELVFIIKVIFDVNKMPQLQKKLRTLQSQCKQSNGTPIIKKLIQITPKKQLNFLNIFIHPANKLKWLTRKNTNSEVWY